MLPFLKEVGIGSASHPIAHPKRDDTVNGSDFVELPLLILGIRSGFCHGRKRSLYNTHAVLCLRRATACADRIAVGSTGNVATRRCRAVGPQPCVIKIDSQGAKTTIVISLVDSFLSSKKTELRHGNYRQGVEICNFQAEKKIYQGVEALGQAL